MVKKLVRFYCISIAVIAVLCLINIYVESGGYCSPESSKTDLKYVIKNISEESAMPASAAKSNYSAGNSDAAESSAYEDNGISENKYEEIFNQTGLGKPAVDELLKTEDGFEIMSQCQDNYFSEKRVKCKRSGMVSCTERFCDDSGNIIRGFRIATVRNGDIFITFSGHSMGWRHGHAGLVVNCNPVQTLEAVVLGTKSQIVRETKWETYSTFVQLRLKEEFGGETLANEVAEYAVENLIDIDYGLLSSKNSEETDKVQCAYIIWKAFDEAGIDIDGNGGRLVIPEDIFKSEYFDIVQVFGIRVN